MASRADFELAFVLLIGHEGGYVNDPRDPGGETKYGISKRSYPHLNIRSLTLAQAHEIYLADFWRRAGCHDMPPRLAFIVFDAAVNNGVAAAVRWLQTAVGAAVDGAYGPNTRIAMLRAVERDETHVLVEVHAHRLRMMAELKTWPTFRGGWSRRLARLPLEAGLTWPFISQA